MLEKKLQYGVNRIKKKVMIKSFIKREFWGLGKKPKIKIQTEIEYYKNYYSDLISINDELPKKGKDIIGFDTKGDKYYCYRCNCINENCIEWRDSITGGQLLVEIVLWEYDENMWIL